MRRRRKNPGPLVLPIAAGAAAVGGLLYLAFRKKDGGAVVPPPMVIVEEPEGALPLDPDGFPTEATRRFVADNGLKERAFGPILESTDRDFPSSSTPVVEVSGTQDNFAPLEGDRFLVAGVDEQPEEVGFFDSVFS